MNIEDESLTIKITLNPGCSMHYHSHKNRDEIWVVIAGEGKVILDGRERKVNIGDIIEMKAGIAHMIFAFSTLKLIEVQIGKEISVEDKVKENL